jgi:hypothetical protein
VISEKVEVGAAPLVASIAIGIQPEEASQLLLSESVVVTYEYPCRMPMKKNSIGVRVLRCVGNFLQISSRAICGHLGRKGGFLLSRHIDMQMESPLQSPEHISGSQLQPRPNH